LLLRRLLRFGRRPLLMTTLLLRRLLL